MEVSWQDLLDKISIRDLMARSLDEIFSDALYTRTNCTNGSRNEVVTNKTLQFWEKTAGDLSDTNEDSA